MESVRLRSKEEKDDGRNHEIKETIEYCDGSIPNIAYPAFWNRIEWDRSCSKQGYAYCIERDSAIVRTAPLPMAMLSSVVRASIQLEKGYQVLTFSLQSRPSISGVSSFKHLVAKLPPRVHWRQDYRDADLRDKLGRHRSPLRKNSLDRDSREQFPSHGHEYDSPRFSKKGVFLKL
ncbi:hypothetical protein L2E82_39605 [Cichorium intybus]|uniref:Uncharacterized protein n=1 Tax=Cichorium intybus TaxID=13427 RepID=A0ACB9AI08_CICIN|nr:hypothetical protein L2E82_39605 [Cichorium intybus]